ncbi:hypothetical protein V2J09_014197 [Rumex salicifolius]
MGAVPSTPRYGDSRPQETAEYLIGTFVGEKSFPLASEFWQKLLEAPLGLNWSTDRVRQACEALAQNNFSSRHLAKLLIHLAFCLQECISTSDTPSTTYSRAVNATYLSSVFLKYMIENMGTDSCEVLYLLLDENEAVPSGYPKGQTVGSFVIKSILCFIGSEDISPSTYILHYELLNFMIVAMSSQLLSGPSPGPRDFHPFIDAAMIQETSLVALVVHRLLINYISRPRKNFSSASYSMFSEGNQPGVLKRFGSAAASVVLLPLNLFVGSVGDASRSLLADASLHLLLILIHYRKCIISDDSTVQSDNHASSDSILKEHTYFSENPYCQALEMARDIEFDRVDIEGNAHSGPLVRVPFASLFDTLAMCIADESATLLLYSLVHGNAGFLEYVLVRTDIDTLLMPILETLYNAHRRSSNQIYMLLIILLILSQDSSFNASIHKLMIPNVPWYKERRLHYTSLGSLLVIVLVRTVKYNLSKLRYVIISLQDVYLHTNCLAALANMAPHVHRLSSYASQRLVILFDMLSRKYTKLAEQKNNLKKSEKGISIDGGDDIPVDTLMELHTYTDFLRIVLEIINAILTYALPRNPEVVYAILQRQEVFEPFKSHPRFQELLENIFTVLDFFNNRMDAHEVEGEWSVEKVLQVINMNCKSWRGEGMKMFTQFKFTYEQESHPEEFFIPYVWQLTLSNWYHLDPLSFMLKLVLEILEK